MHVPEPRLSPLSCSWWARWPRASSTAWVRPHCCCSWGWGMLLGEDGPGGIRFDDAVLGRDVGLLALAVILLEGGMLADSPTLRRRSPPRCSWPRSVWGSPRRSPASSPASPPSGVVQARSSSAQPCPQPTPRRCSRLSAGSTSPAPDLGDAGGRERAQRPVRGAARDRNGRLENVSGLRPDRRRSRCSSARSRWARSVASPSDSAPCGCCAGCRCRRPESHP